jgi:hypothetical protein
VPVGALQYSTQSLISSSVPVPALVQMYAWAPSSAVQARNSSVPNRLGSLTRQARSNTAVRSGPTAFFQW